MPFWIDTTGDVINVDPNSSAALSAGLLRKYQGCVMADGPYDTAEDAENARQSERYSGHKLLEHPVSAFAIAVIVLAVFVKISNKVRK